MEEKKIDELYSILKEKSFGEMIDELISSNDDGRAVLNDFVELGEFFLDKGDIRTGLRIMEKGRLFAEENCDEEGKMYMYNNIAYSIASHYEDHDEIKDSELKRAREYSALIIEFWESEDRKGSVKAKYLGQGYWLRGYIHFLFEEYEKGIKPLEKSVELYESCGLEHQKALSLMHLAYCYYYIDREEHTETIAELLEDARDIFMDSDDADGLSEIEEFLEEF